MRYFESLKDSFEWKPLIETERIKLFGYEPTTNCETVVSGVPIFRTEYTFSFHSGGNLMSANYLAAAVKYYLHKLIDA